MGGSIETTNYFFANGELVAKKNPDGSKVYFHNDHLGSTTLTTNQAGAQVEVTSYDPWGKVQSGGNQNKYQYTGQEKDAETGLNYYGARYYSSTMQHFTQPDPVIQNVYDPQMLNRYAYARNNPLKYTDPSGKVVSCNVKTGCSSDIKVLNNSKPKNKPSSYREFQNNIPKPSSNQPGRQSALSNSGGGNSGSHQSSTSNNDQVGASPGVSVLGGADSASQPKIPPVKINSSNIGTAGLCVSANLGVAAYAGSSFCAVVTSNREFLITSTFSGGGTPSFASGLSVGPILSTAKNAGEFVGKDVGPGASAWVVEGDFSWDPDNPDIQSLYVGGGPPLPDISVGGTKVPVPVEGHFTGNDTVPLLYVPF